MKYPVFLKEGGTIGFPAPSFGASIEPYKTILENALKTLKEKGFEVNPGPNAFAGKGVGISNKPEICAEELTEMYLDPKNDVLVSVGGGELMCETLVNLDLERFKPAEPKWFMGYSDNTNFGFVLATVLDTASLYGPNSSEFGMEKWHESVQDCLDLLMGKNLTVHGYERWESEADKGIDNPLAGYNLNEETRITSFNWDKREISGRFIGGCLDVLSILCGTRFDKVREFSKKYSDEGIIWFLEACDLSPTGIRRALWQLDNAGWFENTKAVIFGRPMRIKEGPDFIGVDEYSAARAVFDKYNIPIIMDADIGHLPPIMTMINGGYGTLAPYRDNIQLKFELK